MKILGQLLIALLGGIVAILLYRGFERSSGNYNNGAGNNTSLIRRIGLGVGEADSINNVFSVGFGAAAESTLAEVVHIRSRMAVRAPSDPFYEFFGDRFWGPQYRDSPQQRQYQEAAGSGVILSPDGYIVTNHHVVNNATEIIVSLYNGRSYTASVVGGDPSTDLAVLKIEAEELPSARLADSDQVRIGDWVLAVGNPFNLASTVTAGIVSAKARNINILNDNSAIESFIQTDAAVNPGNSGGALVNLEGDLIGINTAIATPTGTFAGYAFAVPSNIVRRVVDDIIAYGEVRRGYLGVTIRNLDWQLAREMDLETSQGVVIESVVPRGAADKAGLKSKDVILEINNQPVRSTAELIGIVAVHKPGDELTLTILRDEKEREVDVELQTVQQGRPAATP